MSILLINSIEIPVLEGSFGEVKPLEFGGSFRSYSGAAMSTFRARKRSWQGALPWSTLADCEAYRNLILGLGYKFSCSQYYSDIKGLWPDTATHITIAAGGKYGNKMSIADGQSATWGTYLGSAWSIALYRYVSAAWHHYVVRSDGAKWYDGSRADGTTTTFLSVDSDGDFTLAGGSGSAEDYDEIIALPYLMPTTWPALIYARSAAYPSLPELECSGDALPASTTCRGFIEQIQERTILGSIYRSLSFRLEEA